MHRKQNLKIIGSADVLAIAIIITYHFFNSKSKDVLITVTFRISMVLYLIWHIDALPARIPRDGNVFETKKSPVSLFIVAFIVHLQHTMKRDIVLHKS